MGEGRRVLLADDNADMRALSSSGCSTLAGYRVDAVADGGQRSMRRGGIAPDLILSDVMMPEARRLRRCCGAARGRRCCATRR